MWIYICVWPIHAQSCLTRCDPHGLEPTRLLYPWNFSGKSTGVGCHFLLQGIKPRSPALQADTFYCLSHLGSPFIHIYIYIYYTQTYKQWHINSKEHSNLSFWSSLEKWLIPGLKEEMKVKCDPGKSCYARKHGYIKKKIVRTFQEGAEASYKEFPSTKWDIKASKPNN